MKTRSQSGIARVCEFQTLASAAMTLGEMERFAGVCDREITWRAVSRAVRDRGLQWGKFMGVLKRRMRLRFDRGELLHAERWALAFWSGEPAGELRG